MRDKQALLEEAHIHKLKASDYDATASLHERLTIEVLIDIRDQLSALTTILGTIDEKLAHTD